MTSAGNPLLAGAIGGALAVLVSKMTELLAAWYAGANDQLLYADKIMIALLAGGLAILLFLAGPRSRETRKLAEENERRLDQIFARLEDLEKHTGR